MFWARFFVTMPTSWRPEFDTSGLRLQRPALWGYAGGGLYNARRTETCSWPISCFYLSLIVQYPPKPSRFGDFLRNYLELSILFRNSDFVQDTLARKKKQKSCLFVLFFAHLFVSLHHRTFLLRQAPPSGSSELTRGRRAVLCMRKTFSDVCRCGSWISQVPISTTGRWQRDVYVVRFYIPRLYSSC